VITAMKVPRCRRALLFGVEYKASHTATADTVLDGGTTNGNGETASCMWIVLVISPTVFADSFETL